MTKRYTLHDLVELTQELLNDPNMKHRSIPERSAIYAQAAQVLLCEEFSSQARELSERMQAHFMGEELSLQPHSAEEGAEAEE